MSTNTLKSRTRRLTTLAALVLAALAAGQTSPAIAGSEGSSPPTLAQHQQDPQALATQAAEALIRDGAPTLKIGKDDAFVTQDIVSGGNLHFTSYERTWRGLHVVGGDFVVVTDDSGNVVTTSVAQTRKVRLDSATPAISRSRAVAVARTLVRQVRKAQVARLVVWQGQTSHLAWEVAVSGLDRHSGDASALTAYVDARSGRVVSSEQRVRYATGNTAHAGTVTFPTTQSGSTYSMRYPGQANLACQNYSSGKVYSGTDDIWGNGSRTDLETACADAFYAVDQERQMLSEWLGRDGMDGEGGWVPIKMGLDKEDAYYNGKAVTIGRLSKSRAWMSWIDVVAHEFGHGVDDHSPGGISDDTTAEFIADSFGTATEFYANNPVDTPDFLVGVEEGGAIRDGADPSSLGAPNCFDKNKIASTETHDAAGPGDHWFYLLSEGSDPTNGQPESPTCNGKSVTGVGVKSAIQVLYNAMQMKTSSTSYPKYRLWTLTAAKSMDSSCDLYRHVKAAWDAVSVPAQSGEPTCGVPEECNGQLLGNAGFESGAASPWTASDDVIDDSGDQAARSGDYKAWLNGFGETNTSQLSQRVTIPADCYATLSFYLHVGSDETTRSSAYDRLTVKIGSTTLDSFTNLDEASGYTRYSYDVSDYAGETVTITFSGKEDNELATSFLIDDTALSLS
jgi:Zn-dependent metalloprotease